LAFFGPTTPFLVSGFCIGYAHCLECPLLDLYVWVKQTSDSKPPNHSIVIAPHHMALSSHCVAAVIIEKDLVYVLIYCRENRVFSYLPFDFQYLESIPTYIRMYVCVCK
jgi:hypothetical protein